jgi:hypothetical protein
MYWARQDICMNCIRDGRGIPCAKCEARRETWAAFIAEALAPLVGRISAAEFTEVYRRLLAMARRGDREPGTPVVVGAGVRR